MRQNLRRGVWDVGCGQHAAQGCPARKRDYRLPDGWVHPFLMYGYQSLQAWKRADAAVEVVLRALETKNHPKTFAIFDQIRRATISVAANIVEGYALGTVPLYRKHLRIAFGSAAEAEYLMRKSPPRFQ
ncbi:MAG: hypothetical protein DMD62_14415 [Gemmatimonadetes bacterium]|nr:MAG: hypothetical protein DMD62_14415 [Gemmatimonadota bacterium]